MHRQYSPFILLVLLIGCGPEGAEPIEIVCGRGTVLVGNECQAASEPVSCGQGLVLKNGTCETRTPDPDVQTFLGSNSHNQSGDAKVYARSPVELVHDIRQVWTDLSSTDARAWGVGEAPMIGNGMALHFLADTLRSEDRFPSENVTFSAPLDDLTQADGSCLPGLAPTSKDDLRMLAIFQWTAGKSTAVACARAGSVTVTHSRHLDEVEINAVLGDGTEIRKSFRQAITN